MHLSILPACVCVPLSFLVPIEEKFTLLICICFQRHILELWSLPLVSKVRHHHKHLGYQEPSLIDLSDLNDQIVAKL